ncbi:MAG: DegV family protein [Acidimicrobiales bacterium]
MIAIVTDSNSQIPPSLVERFGVTVVPLSVTVDGMAYLEGVNLGADEFFARFEDGATPPTVTTAQPSPGQFAAAYDRLVARGAEAVLSVHIGSSVSGTVNSARLAAEGVTVPVRIVDTGTASFAIALCAWAAAEAIAASVDVGVEDAAAAAERTAAATGNVFIIGALDLARAGGRLSPDLDPAATAAVPVLTMADGVMQVVGQAEDVDGAVDAMVSHVGRGGEGLRVGVGLGDRTMAPLCEALEQRVAALPNVSEVVRYRIGPSVGAHTGPGTVGVMFAPGDCKFSLSSLRVEAPDGR